MGLPAYDQVKCAEYCRKTKEKWICDNLYIS